MIPPRNEPPKGKLYLRRVRLNGGGYDTSGAYYGVGQRLYHCCDDAGTLDHTFRAFDRDDAKDQIRDLLQPFVCGFFR